MTNATLPGLPLFGIAAQPLWKKLGFASEQAYEDWLASTQTANAQTAANPGNTVGVPPPPPGPSVGVPPAPPAPATPTGETYGPPAPSAPPPATPSAETFGPPVPIAAPVSAPPVAISNTFTPNLPEGIGHNLTSAAFSPDLNPEMTKLQSERDAAQIGLPKQLFQIPSGYNNTTYAQGTGYLPQSNSISVAPGWWDNGKMQHGDQVLHEALHSLEFNLSPAERDQLNQIIAANPPKPGFALEHHPVSTNPSESSGITDYFDYLYANGGNVPIDLLNFVRTKAPEIANRLRRNSVSAPVAPTPASPFSSGAVAAPASSVTPAQSAPAPAANATAGFTGPGEAYTPPPPKETLLQKYGDLVGLHHPAVAPKISDIYAPGEAASNAAGNYVQNKVGGTPGQILGAAVRQATNPINLGLMGAGAPLDQGVKAVLPALSKQAVENALIGGSSEATQAGARAIGANPTEATIAGLAGGLGPGLGRGVIGSGKAILAGIKEQAPQDLASQLKDATVATVAKTINAAKNPQDVIDTIRQLDYAQRMALTLEVGQNDKTKMLELSKLLNASEAGDIKAASKLQSQWFRDKTVVSNRANAMSRAMDALGGKGPVSQAVEGGAEGGFTPSNPIEAALGRSLSPAEQQSIRDAQLFDQSQVNLAPNAPTSPIEGAQPPHIPQDYVDTPNAAQSLTPTRPPELDNRVPVWMRAGAAPEETAASSTATAAPGYQSIDDALAARNAVRERILSGGGGDNVPPSNTTSAAAPAPHPDNLETTGGLASQVWNEAKGTVGAAVSVKSSLSPPILRQGMTRLVTNPVEAMREGWTSITKSLDETAANRLNDTIANNDWVRATQGGENTANLAAERFAKGLGVAPEGASVVPNAGYTWQDVGGTLLDWRGAQDLMRQSQDDLVALAAKNSVKLPEGASKSTIARILSNELKPEELQGLNNSRIGSAVQNFAPIKLSDRQMALQLNLNRTNWYSEVASKMWQAGNRNVDDYTELRKAIENFTQRGSWGQGSVPFFFSTRALSGRVQTVGRMLDVLVHPADAFQPGARQEAAKVLLGMTGASMAFIGGAAVAAKQLGMPASVNWGNGLPTLQIGNSHYDPWAGWNSLAKLVVGVGRDINKEFQNSKTNGWADLPQNAFSDLFNRSLEFGRKGLSPLVGLAVDTGTKKTYYGAKFNLAKEISSGSIVSDLIAPFILQDLYDAYRYDGLRGVGLNTVPSFFSAGVNAYPPTQATNTNAIQDWLNGAGQGGGGSSQVQSWLNGGQ